MDVNEFKKKKKNGGGERGVGAGWGVRLDVNEELKCLGKFRKKKFGGGMGRVGGGGGGQGGCERNVGGRG